MFVWFAALSVVIVALVFRSPAIDYRTVALGALLPWVDALLGGPRVLHALSGAVVLLVLVMATTKRRRLLRRRLLGVPIGMFCHLLLDGTFTTVQAFWWPFAGTTFASGQVPEIRHLGFSIVLEILGFVVAWWAWRTFGLDRPAARRRFLTEGRLDLPS
ncbi:MAG: hypothetical protein KDB02_08765 [Acidimicrobiales bacterium]|nr:hypothetical protein [Acidimicrobiales bacterium]